MVCKKCGAPLQEGALYCDECGNKIETIATDTTYVQEVSHKVYNDYSNPDNSNDTNKIAVLILIILLSILFFLIGFFTGKYYFQTKDYIKDSEKYDKEFNIHSKPEIDPYDDDFYYPTDDDFYNYFYNNNSSY